MSRHYTPQDRQFALERVIANHGDISRTAKELGISARSLYEWRKSAKMHTSQLQNLQNLHSTQN